MKITDLILILSICLSCAKRNPAHQDKLNPLKELESMRDSLRSQIIRANTFPILTKNLDLVFPNPDKKGKVLLFGRDAQMAYQSMRVESKNINDSDFYTAMNQKNGSSMMCLEMVSVDEEEGTSYGCELEVQYELGGKLNKIEPSSENLDVPQLLSNYEGSHLYLNSTASDESYILLKENTALVLYTLMNVRETEITKDEIQKSGEDYTCTKIKSDVFDDKITCKFTINHEKG